MRCHPPAAAVFRFVLLGVLLSVAPGAVRAQAPTGPDTTESTTNDSTGIITVVSPHRTITVDSGREGSFTYRLGQDLHISGPDNRPLPLAQLRPGDEATVFYYVRDGQQTVGRIVVLRRGKLAGK